MTHAFGQRGLHVQLADTCMKQRGSAFIGSGGCGKSRFRNPGGWRGRRHQISGAKQDSFGGREVRVAFRVGVVGMMPQIMVSRGSVDSLRCTFMGILAGVSFKSVLTRESPRAYLQCLASGSAGQG